MPATLVAVWLGHPARRRARCSDATHVGGADPRRTASSRRWSRSGCCSSRAATSAASCSTWRSASASSASSSAASTIEQPAFKAFERPDGPTGALFPFLFVTIACGACSGFHGLVCSGTTSKQIAKRDALPPVGYGAMLLEGFVALIALATVMIVDADADSAARGPGAHLRPTGSASSSTVVVGDEQPACSPRPSARWPSRPSCSTRSTSRRGSAATSSRSCSAGAVARRRVVATALTAACRSLFVLERRGARQPPTYMRSGRSSARRNQLLAALTLLGITRVAQALGQALSGSRCCRCCSCSTITLWALVLQIRRGAQTAPRAERRHHERRRRSSAPRAGPLHRLPISAVGAAHTAAVSCLTRIGEPPSRQGLGVSGAPRTGPCSGYFFQARVQRCARRGTAHDKHAMLLFRDPADVFRAK